MPDMAEIQDIVLQVMEKKQKRMMMKDLLKEVLKINADIGKRDLKKATSAMITDQRLAYWSSGSTTYFALPGSKAPEGED